MTHQSLRSELVRLMSVHEAGGMVEPEVVDRLALEVLRYQARHSPVYRALLERRGLEASALDHWTSFPPVPARVFRSLRVTTPPPERSNHEPEAIFRTSGTTSGPRGMHLIHDLRLYEAALTSQARRHLSPGAEGGFRRVLNLLPTPESRPDSSLVHMASVLLKRWDDGAGGWFSDADWSLDMEGLCRALRQAAADGVPTLVMGTAFAWVHWLEGVEGLEGLEGLAGLDGAGGLDDPAQREASPEAALRLPAGSCIVETGGFKGRSRQVPRPELYDGLARVFDLPESAIVNEYGMTEMLSQFWEPESARNGPLEARWHEGPPWVRTRVLDPATLEPVEEGAVGLLCHLDLANLHSAALILTEDLGRVAGPGGIQVLGRAGGAVPRGCSLAIEEVMEAAGSGEVS